MYTEHDRKASSKERPKSRLKSLQPGQDSEAVEGEGEDSDDMSHKFSTSSEEEMKDEDSSS